MTESTQNYTPRLKTTYRESIKAALKEEFGYSNDMMIPRLDKIVINMGVGEATQDKKKVDAAAAEMEKCAQEIVDAMKAAVEKAKGKFEAPKTATGPMGRSSRRMSGRGSGWRSGSAGSCRRSR